MQLGDKRQIKLASIQLQCSKFRGLQQQFQE